jgi:hypothetical protein
MAVLRADRYFSCSSAITFSADFRPILPTKTDKADLPAPDKWLKLPLQARLVFSGIEADPGSP